MNPRISVITVTYNCKKELEKTVLSIRSQNYSDFEYIIIDGKSTDGTLDIIKANSDIISYWTSEKDNGIYDAMNKGIGVSKGQYIIFMNAGDTFFNEETLLKIPFEKYPNADIFYGETVITASDGTVLGLRRKKLPSNLNWKHFKKGMVVCHQSIFVNRRIVSLYNLNYTYSADIDWVLMVLKASEQTVFTNTIISRFAEGGFSSRNKKNSWSDRFIILKRNFGLWQCILSHIVFIFENLLIYTKIIPPYRKNYIRNE